MAYVVLCNEPGVDSYVLPTGGSLARAQEIMRSAAEEFLDEAAVSAIEVGDEPGGLVIDVNESGTITTVYNMNSELPKEQSVVLRMELTAVELSDG